jgi:hypothetical protein
MLYAMATSTAVTYIISIHHGYVWWVLGLLGAITSVTYRYVVRHNYVAMAYNISVCRWCDGPICPHCDSTHRWCTLILYATATATAMAYNIIVCHDYVAMVYRKLCMPWICILPIGIFLVVVWHRIFPTAPPKLPTNRSRR